MSCSEELQSGCLVPRRPTRVRCGCVFGSHARVVPQDTDTSGNLSDAQIDSGFAQAERAVPHAKATACRSPPPAVGKQTHASLTFSGAGNIVPAPPLEVVVKKATAPKCKRVLTRKKVKKRVECVKPKRAEK